MTIIVDSSERIPSFYTKTTEYSLILVHRLKKQIKIFSFFIVSKCFFRHNFSTIRILCTTIATVQVERLIVVLLIYVYIMYAHAIHSSGSMADRRPRLEITTSVAKRIGRPQIRGSMNDLLSLHPHPWKERNVVNPSQDSMIPGSRRLSLAGGASV